MKIIFRGFLTSVALFLFGCNNNETITETKNSVTATTVVEENPEDSVKMQVTKFLRWYKAEISTLSTLSFVTIPDNDNNFYSVNFNNTDEYLKVLKQSGLFSKKFLDNKSAYFKTCNERMQKERQKDGPPIGLEHDLLLLTQDIDNTLAEMDRVTFSDYKRSGKTAYINSQLINQLKFTLASENGVWLIDAITLADVPQNLDLNSES